MCNISDVHHASIPRWWFQRFFIFTPMGKISDLTNIFQMGWNHQLDFNFTANFIIAHLWQTAASLQMDQSCRARKKAVYSHDDWETCGHDVWNADGLCGRREVKRGGWLERFKQKFVVEICISFCCSKSWDMGLRRWSSKGWYVVGRFWLYLCLKTSRHNRYEKILGLRP